MKKVILLLACVVLIATPCKAYTQEEYYSYIKGIQELGNIATFVQSQYSSELTDTFLNTMYYSEAPIFGVTDPSIHKIYVGTNQPPSFIEYTTIHEYAHGLSNILGLSEVHQILYAEMPNLYNYQVTYNPLNIRGQYCATNPDEYFSEAFAMYYFHNKELKRVCPTTYEYIRQININFNGSYLYNYKYN